MKLLRPIPISMNRVEPPYVAESASAHLDQPEQVADEVEIAQFNSQVEAQASLQHIAELYLVGDLEQAPSPGLEAVHSPLGENEFDVASEAVNEDPSKVEHGAPVRIESVVHEAPVETRQHPLADALRTASAVVYENEIYIPEAELAPEVPSIVKALPASLEAALANLVELRAPEAEDIIESIEKMSLVADRLHLVHQIESADELEILQIENVLAEYYDQLCAIAKHIATQEDRDAFIAAIIGDVNDDGTHESKHGMLAQFNQPEPDIRITKLGQFLMQLGTLQQVAG